MSRSRLPRLGLALLAGAVSTAALALSAPPSAGWKADPDEQFLLEVAIRQMRLGDGARAYATPEGVCVILADVVAAQSAAGTEIGTLFIDEGFGTLDADTLEEVMEVLDGLRDGGRAVGIVSHVAELRGRIPARLQVRRGRGGSTVAVAAPFSAAGRTAR